MGAQVEGKSVVFNIAYQHIGKAMNASFFAHASVPGHSEGEVSAGCSLGTAKQEVGDHTCTVKASLAALKKAGLTPGNTAYLACKWDGVTHYWGTNCNVGSNHAEGTSVVLPGTQNSRLRSLWQPTRRVWRAPLLRAYKPQQRRLFPHSVRMRGLRRR